MTVSTKMRKALLVAIIALAGAGAAEWMSAPVQLSLVSSAEARVGRPLTPVSVAGVARRTARRCAAGVYYC
jgi:hypothetical protein